MEAFEVKTRLLVAAAVTFVVGAILLGIFALAPWVRIRGTHVAAQATIVPAAAGAGTPLVLAVSTALPATTAVAEATQAVNPATRTISVLASGIVKVQPDVVYITLGVQTVGSTAHEAIGENANRMDAVLVRLGELGVAKQDLRTAGLSLYPNGDTVKSDGSSAVTRYRAFNNVTITLADVAKAASIIDGAVAAGANNMASVTYSVKDDSAAQVQAVREAVKAARPRAEAIAAMLGVTIKDVLLVEEQGGGSGPMTAAGGYGGGMGAASSAATPLNPGDISVGASVRVTYSY